MRVSKWAVFAAVILGAAGAASAQSVTNDFTDGTDQGWGAGFGDDASKSFTITNIGGSNRMYVPRTGAFQEAGVSTGNPSAPLFLALQAAAANEAGYVLTYDWYVDTTALTADMAGTFLQVGTFVNTGSGAYQQNFPNTGKEVELNGSQLSAPGVYSGTVSQTFAAKGFDILPTETFYRMGIILNGNGSGIGVYFDNITVAPVNVPEPAGMGWLAGAGLIALRRRR